MNKNDNYEIISVEMTHEEIAAIAIAAHEKDMTLNEFMNYALEEYLKDFDYGESSVNV